MTTKRKNKYDNSSGLTGLLWAPESNWSAPSEFPNLKGVKELAIDIESRDPELSEQGPGFIRGTAEVVGVSIATADRGWYFPIAHLGGGNMDKLAVGRYLRDTCKTNNCRLIGANLSYDLEGLSTLGINHAKRFYDIQLVEALIDEERDENYTLNTLCATYLGQGKDESLLNEAASAFGVSPKGGLWKLHAKYVGAYAEYDAWSTFQIAKKQEAIIKKECLEQIVDLEMRLIPVLHAMRMQGIPIDLEKAALLSKRLAEEEDVLAMRCIKEFGRDINPWSNEQICSTCDELGIAYPTTKAGSPSFKGDWLEEHSHPFPQLVSDLRQINKLRKTFIDSWIFKNHINGRIHPQWKQLMSDEGGTRTGRMAASNPNPQQIPASKRKSGAPNPIGAEIRSLFIPSKGMKWAKIDYSQQEPRILTHFAAACNLSGAEAAAFAYRSDKNMDFYKFLAEVAGCERRRAKTVYLGLCYGMGKEKMAAQLGTSKADVDTVLNDFNNRAPFIRELSDKCQQLAETRGWIKTLCGRKRHFNYWEPAYSNYLRDQGIDVTRQPLNKAQLKWPGHRLQRAGAYKALNALIQGSAADMMKAGLVKAYEEDGRVPFITVHDEVGGEVVDQADADKWLHTMETCVELSVPIRGDLNVGPHWK